MRLKLLALVARLLGIQFKVNGLPYGAQNPRAGSCLVKAVHEERNDA